VFEISKLPITKNIDRNVSLEAFSNLEFLAYGSNSHIYGAIWKNEQVVVKMLQNEKMTSAVALHEFEIECELLSRIDHPNVIKVGSPPPPSLRFPPSSSFPPLLFLPSCCSFLPSLLVLISPFPTPSFALSPHPGARRGHDSAPLHHPRAPARRVHRAGPRRVGRAPLHVPPTRLQLPRDAQDGQKPGRRS
jgi:hypothetical protein